MAKLMGGALNGVTLEISDTTRKYLVPSYPMCPVCGFFSEDVYERVSPDGFQFVRTQQRHHYECPERVDTPLIVETQRGA